MEDQIYLSISEELMSVQAKAYFASKSLPEIKTVALFNSQYRNEPTEKAYSLPAVFIEFSTANYLPQGKNTEDVQDRVRIHIEQKNFATADHNSHNQAIALNVLRFISAVHVVVAKTKLEGVGSMYRVGRELDTNHGNAPVHIWEYAMQYIDCSTDKYGDYEESGEDVTVVATKQLVDHLENAQSASNPYIV